MGGIGVCAGSLAQHVDHPVRLLAAVQQGVESPGGSPHDVGSGFVVLRILHRDEGALDHRLHESLCDIVRGVVVISREVLLADVVEYVVYTGCHLIHGKAHGEPGIEDGELRHDLRAEDVTDLLPGLVVSDDRSTVHLGACACHRQNAAHGNDLAARSFIPGIVLVPGILIAVDGDGYRLGVVAA